MKLTYPQLMEIKNSLDTLGKLNCGIFYELAKNKRKVAQVISDVQAITQELFEKFCDKNEDGTPKQFPVPNMPGQAQMRISDEKLLTEYNKELQKVILDEYEIEFVKIPLSKFRGERLQADTFVPLIDTVVEEEKL